MLRRGTFAEANEFPVFRVVTEAIEIGILSGPIPEAVPCRKCLFERLERLCFFPKDAVGARSIVKRVGISGTKGDGGLQVSDALVRVLGEMRDVRGQQDPGPYVFRN